MEMRDWKSWVLYFQLLCQFSPSWLQQCKTASVQVTKQHIYRECKYPSTEYEATERTEGCISCPLCSSVADYLSCLVYLFGPLLSHRTENEGRKIPAYRFPNVSHLTFNCGYADFIALGKILSFPQCSRNTRLYRLPLKTPPLACQTQRK